jgi:hypothetical protein
MRLASAGNAQKSWVQDAEAADAAVLVYGCKNPPMDWRRYIYPSAWCPGHEERMRKHKNAFVAWLDAQRDGLLSECSDETFMDALGWVKAHQPSVHTVHPNAARRDRSIIYVCVDLLHEAGFVDIIDMRGEKHYVISPAGRIVYDMGLQDFAKCVRDICKGDNDGCSRKSRYLWLQSH